MDQWRCQPSEFDVMPYYRIEYMEEDLAYFLEQRKSGNNSSNDSIAETESYMKQMKTSQAAMTKNMTSFKMPSFKMPKL